MKTELFIFILLALASCQQPASESVNAAPPAKEIPAVKQADSVQEAEPIKQLPPLTYIPGDGIFLSLYFAKSDKVTMKNEGELVIFGRYSEGQYTPVTDYDSKSHR